MKHFDHEMDRFEILLNYEIVCSTRYRRFMSLILFEKNGDDGDGFAKRVLNEFRNCDRLFNLSHEIVVILPETDVNGVHCVCDRLLDNHAVRGMVLAYASFPADGQTSATLMKVARLRLFHKLPGD